MDVYRKIGELSTEGRTAALCTIVSTEGSTPRKAGSKMVVTGKMTTFGSVGGGKIEQQVIADATECIASGHTLLKEYSSGEDNDMHCYGKCSIFIDPLPNNYSLYIFGAGHVGQALAKIAGNYGFRINLIDHREELINKLDIEGVNNHCMEYEDAIAELAFDKRTFIVVCTPSHDWDEAVSLGCANKPHAYLGMIGSKKKVSLAKEFFLKEGMKEEVLNNIDMPIGVPINCETPEEIAISILARLIDVKNKN
jgi:xanthine dehydrogenase accessory factor